MNTKTQTIEAPTQVGAKAPTVQESRMKKVTIMRGCSGSGKSTYARSLNPDVVCSADHYFEDGEGAYNFDPSKLSEAHSACLRKFVESLQNSEIEHIVVDNTNTTAVEIAPYAALAIAHGYELEIVTVATKPEIAAKRNVHNVPESAVKAQYNRLITERLPPWWPNTVASSRLASDFPLTSAS